MHCPAYLFCANDVVVSSRREWARGNEQFARALVQLAWLVAKVVSSDSVDTTRGMYGIGLFGF